MPGADGYALATRCAAAAEYRGTGLRLHARPKSVFFDTVAAVRLKSTLGHVERLLFPEENLRVSNKLKYSLGGEQNPIAADITMRHREERISGILKK